MNKPDEVFFVEAHSSFDWTEIHIHRHPLVPERFAFDAQSGCSCNYYNRPSIEELGAREPVSKVGARARLIESLEAACRYFSPMETVRVLEKFELEVP